MADARSASGLPKEKGRTMSVDLSKCKVNVQLFEHMTVIGPIVKSKEVMNGLFDDGWNITRQGPFTNDDMFPKFDRTRFLFVCEREVKS